MSSILSFDIISIVVPEPKIFLCIPVSAADADAINPNGIKYFQLMVKIHFSLKVNQFSTMDQEVYQEILLIVLF